MILVILFFIGRGVINCRYMKKSTINKILFGIIAFLIVAICVLITQIVTRPRYIDTQEPETAVIAEAESIIDVSSTQETSEESQAQQDMQPSDNIIADDQAMRGKTSSLVNIRDAASEDARVIDTVEEGTEFEILEILDNGWTKIIYDGQEAYISSAYVILIQN